MSSWLSRKCHFENQLEKCVEGGPPGELEPEIWIQLNRRPEVPIEEAARTPLPHSSVVPTAHSCPTQSQEMTFPLNSPTAWSHYLGLDPLSKNEAWGRGGFPVTSLSVSQLHRAWQALGQPLPPRCWGPTQLGVPERLGSLVRSLRNSS